VVPVPGGARERDGEDAAEWPCASGASDRGFPTAAVALRFAANALAVAAKVSLCADPSDPLMIVLFLFGAAKMLPQAPWEQCRAEGRLARSQSGRPPIQGRWPETRSGWERSVPFSSALDGRLESVRRILRSSSQQLLRTFVSNRSADYRRHSGCSHWAGLWL
jgi:hypothetical protein